MGSKTSERNTPHVRDIFRSWADEDYNHKELLNHKPTENDSAVSVGSCSDEEETQTRKHREKKKKKSRDDRRRIEKSTERELLHLERHLSMKKTIRKKMMRDLKQAFVDDPSEFKQDPQTIEPQQRININVKNIHLSPGNENHEKSFLAMLKDNDADSGHSSPTRVKEEGKRKSIWKIFSSRSKSKSKQKSDQ